MSLVICTMPQCQTAAGCICGLNTAKVGDSVPLIEAEQLGETVQFIRAVRVGCDAADVHLTCNYPGCSCKQIPTAIRAALSEWTKVLR
jgi:hypothetical protein